ncbi:uncharacterized protein PGTG_09931 [Puccinia graminis f. sp. tritici CRL 75-36-700-3]|uniref:Tricalbin n=1 Tax=Puccinia graminis f. sp. tritici (strain CRL 75-36-700-3 / race SCCL) TaxID=418459 RepID=E3KFD6_PUCGT|nr:uncharacterized protein PGTG_09931 [Puccinia graminis f. sp. tritici CRL 75-36-700-3]EFP82963.2 hypothetical protein PGTG_09931 [Puccinia graminis f. sp. tritici CRL 75-36-700-3]
MSVKQFDYAINHQQQKKSSLDTQPQTSTILQSDPDHLHHPNHSDSLKSITTKLDNTRSQSTLDPIKTDIDKPSAITQEITSAILTDGTNPEELPLLDHTAGQDNLNQLLESIPGQLNESPLTNKIPDWYKIGWAAQIEHVDLSSKSDQDEAKHLDLIETFLSEVYYGTWFHNAAVIFFAVAASHYITLFGGGWASLIIILAICATYYTTSIRRVRKNVRGDVSRELAKQRLFQDHETVDWLNNFLNRFWLIYEPVLSATIVASVDQILVASTPSFLESIRMSTFTLGSKAPRIDFIRSHPETENDVVVMDWKFDFTPNDVSDLTAKAAAGKINPKIVLTIRFGKGVIGAAKDIVVENISFTGTIRIRIKLMNNFPHLQLIDLSFLEKPEFDFILKPIGFDLNMIPGLSGFIESQVHASLGPMMYDPNVFTLNLEQMLAGALVDSAVGLLQIAIASAQGLKAVKIGGGTPDPYVTFSIGARLNLDRTKVKHSTQSPNWKSVHFLLIHSLNEILTMEIMDYNEVRKDTSLGTASVDLQTLVTEPEQEGLMVPIMYQGKPRGEIRLSMVYHPCLVPKQLENGETEPVPETSAGVTRLVLHQAKELDYKRTGTSNLSPYAKIYLNGKEILKTPVIKRTNNPVYEAFTEVLISSKPDAVFTINMFDDRHGDDPKIGSVNVKLPDLLELTSGEQKLDWFPLVGAKSGKLRISAIWKGIMMAGAINGASAYTPPIGILRFHFDRAEDLKNVEALTGGKSDPYVRVMRSGIVLSRSQIHNNDLDPVFDEIIYVPVHSLKDSFRLEVMDYQHLTKDRSLGHIDLETSKLVEINKEEGTNGYKSTGKHQYSEYLKQEGKKALVKGKMNFTVEFHACKPIKFNRFDTPPSDVDKMKTGQQSDKLSMLTSSDSQSITLINPEGSGLVNGNSVNGKESLEMLDGRPASKSTQAGYDASSIDGSPRAKRLDAVTLSHQHAKPSIDSFGSHSRHLRDEKNSGPPLVELSKDELLTHQSGILVFNIIGGVIAKKNARLEFLFDDGYWPSYSTEPSKSTHPKWDETGESFIRELDWSRCILKLNVADKDTREEVYAEYTSDLKDFLNDCLDGPHDFVLQDLEGGNRSTISIQCRYIPVPITLEPRESINNMGLLTVLLDHGKDLMAADRNGYSDPYAQFVLNGAKVFKSSVQKKTLNPKWTERFDVEIPSRASAEFYVHVYDWDRVGASDKLGQARIDLSNLEPMVQTTVIANLSLSDNKQKGQVQFRMTFRPHFISRSRQATSNFTGGFGRVATGLGGTVLSAGAGVGLGAAKGVGTVGGGVIKGVGGVGKLGYAGIRRATGMGNKRASVVEETVPRVPVLDSDLSLPPTASANDSRKRIQSNDLAAGQATHSTPPKANLLTDDFKLNIVVMGLVGMENPGGKMYVQVKRNGKAVHDTKVIRASPTTGLEWNEICTLDAKLGVESELELVVCEKRKLGKDREMGSVRLKLWETVHPDQGRFEAEIDQALEESGGDPSAGSANSAAGHLRFKLSIIDASSSTNVGKEIYNHTRRSISAGNHTFGNLFGSHSNHHHHHQSKAQIEDQQASSVAASSAQNELFLNHDPNPSPAKPPSVFGGRSQRSVSGAGASRFSLHRLR